MYSEYIEIPKEDIPFDFEIDLGGKVYKLEIHYNAFGDFFTVDLSKDNVTLIQGEKLILNRPLFRNFVHADLPTVRLIPADRSGSAKRITYDNFGQTVFLYVVRGEVNE